MIRFPLVNACVSTSGPARCRSTRSAGRPVALASSSLSASRRCGSIGACAATATRCRSPAFVRPARTTRRRRQARYPVAAGERCVPSSVFPRLPSSRALAGGREESPIAPGAGVPGDGGCTERHRQQSMERPTLTALPEIEPFRQGCRDGVLLLRSCRACGRLQYYPRTVCTACPSSDPGWRKASRARMCSLVYNRAPGAELCVRGRPALCRRGDRARGRAAHGESNRRMRFAPTCHR